MSKTQTESVRCQSYKSSVDDVVVQNYLPVCGKDGRDHPNKCAADCNGGGIAYEGMCKPPTPSPFTKPCKCPRVTI